MTDIFISYAREDEMRVRELVDALEGKRWSIFWDRRIPAGKTWQSYIGQALSDARCVIVVWSHHSITSEWVSEEANDAKERGVLVPLLLDSVKPPLGFRGIQAADLTEWKPGYSSPHFEQLIQDIAGVLGAKPPHEPAPPKPEPSETRPHEREPIKAEPPMIGKKRRNFLIVAGIALGLAIVVGLASLYTVVKTPPKAYAPARSPLHSSLILRAIANPPAVSPGQRTRITITAQDENGSPLQGARVEVGAGGGKFLEGEKEPFDPKGRLQGPYSATGVTNETGNFYTWWVCNPCASGYGLAVKADKEGYTATRTDFQIKISQ